MRGDQSSAIVQQRPVLTATATATALMHGALQYVLLNGEESECDPVAPNVEKVYVRLWKVKPGTLYGNR